MHLGSRAYGCHRLSARLYECRWRMGARRRMHVRVAHRITDWRGGARRLIVTSSPVMIDPATYVGPDG